MPENLLRKEWNLLDSTELRLLLDERIGRPGQYQCRAENPNTLYLPLAGEACQIELAFSGGKIIAIHAGPAFDPAKWAQIGEEIESSILAGPTNVGRDYSFSLFRVTGSWRGERSGVQILPPPQDAPDTDSGNAEHPFILEFRMQTTNRRPITNHRRTREHRKLTALLNVLLNGRISLPPHRPEHFWAVVNDDLEIKWVQQFYFAKLGEPIVESLSPPAVESLKLVNSEEYYALVGNDGEPLRVPDDLDASICRYLHLSSDLKPRLDRALYWVDLASRQWNMSVSASFASLVSAIESLTTRGDIHHFNCPVCHKQHQHEVPGPTKKFRDFFETYAPGSGPAKARNDIYALRSSILHGSDLMQLDQGRAFGWDPPFWNERELHDELWGLTRVALRNWLKHPPAR